MIGGEIHYWRLQKRDWDAVLASARKLGVEVIGSYIPWGFHELEPGRYDFDLLHAFLDQLRVHGLRFFARPGPFIYAEYRNWGLPDDVAPFHKQHAQFRARTADWIAAVMDVLRPLQGDLVVQLQADNEIDPMLYYYGEDLGFAGWLRERYGSIEQLNAAWGTTYTAFEQARPSLAPLIKDRRFRDSCRYRYDLANDYARWVVGEYRRQGATVPIVLNTWPGVDAQHWHDFTKLADRFGLDVYPTNECREDYRFFRERLRLLRAVTSWPYLAEFASGIWHGMPRRRYSPDHYRLTALTALASGVKGWNWYMLVDRDNWSGAPINARGVIRPELGSAFEDAVRAYHTLADAPPPAASLAVTWSWHEHQVAQIEKRDVDDPLLAVLHEMGIEYDFVDVDEDFDPPPVLLVCGAIAEPGRLWRYVEAGGHLVMFQRLIAGCPRPDGTSFPCPDELEVSLGFTTPGPVFDYAAVPGTPITARRCRPAVDGDVERIAEQATGRQYLAGYYERRGQGLVMVLGCPPSRAAILALHRFFELDIPVLPLTPGVHATRRGDRIIVLNPGEAKAARLQVGGRELYVDLPRCGGVIV